MCEIVWSVADCEQLVPPKAAEALLRRGLEVNPDNAALHLRLANVHLMQYDFAGAIPSLEAAWRLNPTLSYVTQQLARCHNVLGAHERALVVLEALEAPDRERGLALEALGCAAAAEAEFRSVLERNPHDREAGRRLCQLLRTSGRWNQLLDTCEALGAQGVTHSQFLNDWGVALALTGNEARARALIFDPARIARISLPVPAGWATVEQFNKDLAAELLSNPYRVSDVVDPKSANQGSSRIHSLMAGTNPGIITALLRTIEGVLNAYRPMPVGDFDPWVAACPRAAHLKPWGLLQRDTDYEEFHVHPHGWMSGVYYVRIPAAVTDAGDGPGCIEFAPPKAVPDNLSGSLPPLRVLPREGLLLLAPSHYMHRTIPSGVDEYRISFAFDVVPDRC